MAKPNSDAYCRQATRDQKLRIADISANISCMGRTHRPQVALYLDPDRVKLLHQLAIKTRRTKQHLLREAVDALLVDYKLLKPKRKP